MHYLKHLFLYLSLALVAFADTYQVKVLRVSDGDTAQFEVLSGPNTGTKLKVRFAGIDAPEIAHRKTETGQPFGLEAKSALEKILAKASTLQVEVMELDQYKRMVSFVFADSKNVNVLMVANGYAEVYKEYLKKLPKTYVIDLNKAEKTAKDHKLNIWSLDNYQRPSDYRREQKGSN
jgi:micrococcal nuclease